MSETDKMEELFERLPWLREEFETEQEILEQLVKAESEYLRNLPKIGFAKTID